MRVDFRAESVVKSYVMYEPWTYDVVVKQMEIPVKSNSGQMFKPEVYLCTPYLLEIFLEDDDILPLRITRNDQTNRKFHTVFPPYKKLNEVLDKALPYTNKNPCTFKARSKFTSSQFDTVVSNGVDGLTSPILSSDGINAIYNIPIPNSTIQGWTNLGCLDSWGVAWVDNIQDGFGNIVSGYIPQVERIFVFLNVKCPQDLSGFSGAMQAFHDTKFSFVIPNTCPIPKFIGKTVICTYGPNTAVTRLEGILLDWTDLHGRNLAPFFAPSYMGSYLTSPRNKNYCLCPDIFRPDTFDTPGRQGSWNNVSPYALKYSGGALANQSIKVPFHKTVFGNIQDNTTSGAYFFLERTYTLGSSYTWNANKKLPKVFIRHAIPYNAPAVATVFYYNALGKLINAGGTSYTLNTYPTTGQAYTFFTASPVGGLGPLWSYIVLELTDEVSYKAHYARISIDGNVVVREYAFTGTSEDVESLQYACDWGGIPSNDPSLDPTTPLIMPGIHGYYEIDQSDMP